MKFKASFKIGVLLDTNNVYVVLENDLNSLSQQELREILLEMKKINHSIGEMIVNKSKNSNKLSVDEARAITGLIKEGNISKAIKSHMFYLDSTEKEATNYVNNIKLKLEL